MYIQTAIFFLGKQVASLSESCCFIGKLIIIYMEITFFIGRLARINNYVIPSIAAFKNEFQ